MKEEEQTKSEIDIEEILEVLMEELSQEMDKTGGSPGL